MKPDYVIDLSLPTTRRWAEVAKKDRVALKKLVDVINGYVLSVPKPVFNAISGAYWLQNATYLREANAFADVLGENRALLQAAQLMYELVHLVDKGAIKGAQLPRVGCTTSVAPEDGKATLLRTLDWDLPGMDDCTRLYRFDGDGFRYYAVGTVGAVSVFTAMHENGFAVTLNDAPPVEKLRLGRAPSFQIRRAMELADNYTEAVDLLSRDRMATAAFFVVCGEEKATLLEHTGKEVTSKETDSVVITNHYTIRAGAEEPPANDDSVIRRRAALNSIENKTRAQAYAEAPILQAITQYKARCVPSDRRLELF